MDSNVEIDTFIIPFHECLSDEIQECLEEVIRDYEIKFDLEPGSDDWEELLSLSREIGLELKHLILIRLIRLLSKLRRPVPEKLLVSEFLEWAQDQLRS